MLRRNVIWLRKNKDIIVKSLTDFYDLISQLFHKISLQNTRVQKRFTKCNRHQGKYQPWSDDRKLWWRNVSFPGSGNKFASGIKASF